MSPFEQIDLHGIRVDALSIGGLETCFALPEHKLCFDIGRCYPEIVRYPKIFFSHSHIDHMGGVLHHCAQRDLTGQSPPTYYMPQVYVDDFRQMMQVWRRMTRSELPCHLVGVSPGDEIEVHRGIIRVFRAVHRTPTVGYALCARRQKLRQDLVGAPRETIISRREQGLPITQVHETVELAFCGDTTIDVIDRSPLMRQAKRLLLEVTFLDDRVPPDKARHNGHIHLEHLLPRVEELSADVILCTHISPRYSRAHVLDIWSTRIPEGLRHTMLPLLPAKPD